MEDANNQQRREDARTDPSCEIVFRHPACEVDIAYRVRRVADPCGGDALPDPCMPHGFVAPSAQEAEEVAPVLTARVFARNAEVTHTCAEGLRDNPAFTATVASGAFETSVRLSDLPSATAAQAVVWSSLEQEYLDAAVEETEASLVAYLTLTPVQAAVLYTLLQAAQDAVDDAASASAEQALVCEAWNELVHVRCPDAMWPHPLVDDWFLFADGSATGTLLASTFTGTTDLLHNATNTGSAVLPYDGDDAGIIGGRFMPRTSADVPAPFELAFLVTTQGNPSLNPLKPTATGVMVTSLPGSTQEDRGMGSYAALLREASSQRWKLMYRSGTSGAPTVEDLGDVLMDGSIFPPVWVGVVVAEGGLAQFRKKEAGDTDWVNMGAPVDVGATLQFAGLYGFTGDYPYAVGHGFADASSSLSDVYAPFVTVARGAHIAYAGDGDKTAGEVANDSAMLAALSQLGCHFGNDETSAFCPAGVDELTAWDAEAAVFAPERPSPTRALNTGAYADHQTVTRDAHQMDLDIAAWLSDASHGDGITKEAVNAMAEDSALALLAGAGCFYGNSEIDETCVDRLTEQFPPDPGPSWPEGSIGGSSFTSTDVPGVHVATNAVVSSVSGPAADDLARQVADAEARCFWRSSEGYAGCPDVVLAYDADTETWTADEEGAHVFVAISGTVHYPQGAFTSTDSLDAANAQRDEAGALDALCGYGNKPIGPRCLSKAEEYSSAIPENHIVRATALAAAVEAQSLSQLPSSIRGHVAGHEDVAPEVEPSPGQTCTQGSRPVLAACVEPSDISSTYPEQDSHFLGTSSKGLLANSVVALPKAAVSDTYTNGAKDSISQDDIEDTLTATALLQAQAARSCQFASPALRVHCGASSAVTDAMVEAVDDVADEITLPVASDAATMFNRDSRGSRDNPVLLPAGAVVSDASFIDAFGKAVFEAVSALDCFWKSPRVEVLCGQWDSTDLLGLDIVSETAPEDGSAFDSGNHVVRVSTGALTEPPDRTAVITDWTGNVTDAEFANLQESFNGVGRMQNVFGEPGNLNVDVLDGGATRPRLSVLVPGALTMGSLQVSSYDALVRLAILQAKSQAVCSYTHTSAVWWCGIDPTKVPPPDMFPPRVQAANAVSIHTNPVTEGTFVSTVSQLEAQKNANRELQSRWEQTFTDEAYGCSGDGGSVKLRVGVGTALCAQEKKGIGKGPVPLPLDCGRPDTLQSGSDDTMAAVRAFQRTNWLTHYQRLGISGLQ